MRQRNKGTSADKSLSSSEQQKQTPGDSQFCGIMIAGLLLIATLSVPIVYYFLLPSADQVTYDHSLQFVGVYTVNNELQKARRLFEGDLIGPESFAVDNNGYLYTGVMDGRVVKIDLQEESYTLVTRMGDPPYTNCDGQLEMLAHCGRPLGMRFHNGSLIVVDSYKGLFSVNVLSGDKELLFKPEESGEFSCGLLNNPVVLSNGSIYFTCASSRLPLHAIFASDFPISEYLWEPSKSNDTGSLFHYNPITRQTYLVGGKQLFFPNGIVKSANENFLLIAELSRQRIARYHLKGPNTGQWDLFLSNLPGILDNITPSKRIPGYWVAIPLVRPSALFDFSFQWSLWQRIKAKFGMMNLLDSPDASHTMVLLVDEEGKVIKSMHDPSGKVMGGISEALELNNELIIGSFLAPFVAKITLH